MSSRNSLKHGYYAVVHNLPDEDPIEILRLRARWFADLAPKNVAEEFLTQQCFQAHLQADRVERARRAQLSGQMEAATDAWHDERDDAVGKLWNDLIATDNPRDIVQELRTTTLGLRALVGQWTEHKELLESRGYWLPGELSVVVALSGCRSHPGMLLVDEDAYRLYLWNFRCEPEPLWDMIERMLDPGYRPPGLRGVDRDALLPSPDECLERLKQWVDDSLAELHEDSERVWTEVEAPELARLTGPQTIVRDVVAERQIHRASNEYRAMYYKAHNALEALRKREAAEEKELRKNADREGRADRAGRSAPAVPAELSATPGESRPVASVGVGGGDGEVPSAGEAGSRNDPSSVAETREDMYGIGGRIPRTATAVGCGTSEAGVGHGDLRSPDRRGLETLAEPGPDRRGLETLAEQGSDRRGLETLAEHGSDPRGLETLAEQGSDRRGLETLAEQRDGQPGEGSAATLTRPSAPLSRGALVSTRVGECVKRARMHSSQGCSPRRSRTLTLFSLWGSGKPVVSLR